MKYLLGIDFGGGASKATLLAETGRIVADNTVEYPTMYPKAGYTEQNPSDWYTATAENIAALLDKSGIAAAEIAAVALDAATHTAVLTDENFNVLMPSIYWTDTRCMAEVAELREKYNDLIFSEVLHYPDTIWTLPQLMWVKRNLPEVWGKTRKIMFAKDYVRHQLTGDYVTDYIEAEGSMLFDYTKMDWSEELCAILGISAEMLPRLVRPTDTVGTVTATAAEVTHLAAGTPVICGTTDTAMEVFAAGAVSSGQMTVKLATAGRICVVTDRAYPDRNLINYSHAVDGLYYPGTATKSCAASYRWYRDTFGGSYSELDAAAENIPAGCGGLMFHPYLNGELTPYADPMLCGSFTGIRAGHGKAHFSRAVMEGVAFSLLDCKNALEEIGVPHNETATIIGGGAKSPLWRQIVSDCLGITLEETENSDSSFGSAMLAGVATGVFRDAVCAASTCGRVVSRTVPNSKNTEKYAVYFEKYKKIHDALRNIYHEEWL